METAIFSAISDNSLQQWIEQSRLSDREAFGHIVRKYQGIVSGVVYGILGDFHKAEDLTQDTFLTAWNKLDELRDVEKLPGWLCGIARNQTKKYLQRNAKHAAVALPDEAIFDENSENPTQALIREEQNRKIWAALEKIPEKYRIPLILYYRSEKSVPEIAKTLNLSQETLYVQLTRARKYLRRELEKQVEGTISASGPGEFFSLAVLAALPALSGCAPAQKAVAATVLGPTVIASTSATASGTSSSSGSPISLTFGVTLKAVFAVLAATLMWFFLAVGAVPGVWFAIRNAPTLKARQYLVLTSLRLHFLFGTICCFGFLYPFFETMTIRFLLENRFTLDYRLFAEVSNQWHSSGYLLLGTITLVVCLFSSIRYRMILRQTSQTQKDLPLSRSFRVYAFALFGLYLLTLAGFYCVATFASEQFQRDISFGLARMSLWERCVRAYPVQFGIVGFLFLLVFYFTHRRFLAIAKDEQSYNSAPPIITPETPFFQKAILHWTASFALFLVAGLIFVLGETFYWDWIPRIPIIFEGILLALFLGTLGAAVLGTRFPWTRFVWTLLGIALIFCSGVSYLTWNRQWRVVGNQWAHFPLDDFFDSSTSWPLIFGVIILNAITIFVFLTTLILAGVYLFRRAAGKTTFLSRKMITRIFAVGIGLILLSTPFWFSYAKSDYICMYFCIRVDKDASEHHARKMLALANEAEKIALKTGNAFAPRVIKAYRANVFLRLGEYDQAIADLDDSIELASQQPSTDAVRGYLSQCHNHRGEAKFMKNDWEGAMADFKQALDLGTFDSEALYNRGYLYEKLGENELALADYAERIKYMEQFQNPSPVVSMIPRTPNDKMQVENHRIGYLTTFEELKQIRNRLSHGSLRR